MLFHNRVVLLVEADADFVPAKRDRMLAVAYRRCTMATAWQMARKEAERGLVVHFSPSERVGPLRAIR